MFLMGPSLLFDKSAFESLSRDEHRVAFQYFFNVLPPILALEIVADLQKIEPGATPETLVTRLAGKFLGSGPPIHVGHTLLLRNDLMAADIQMTGRPYPDSLVPVPDHGLGAGIYIPTTPTNEAILRWSRGELRDDEREIARAWRAAKLNFPVEDLTKTLESRGVEIARAPNLGALNAQTAALVNNPELSSLWIDWLLNKAGIIDRERAYVWDRWLRSRVPFATFSPYGHYCMAVDLRFIIASRSELIRVRETDLLDVQYLYYVPFFNVLVSDDTLHVRLAPLGMREDQDFAKGVDFKSDIRARLGEEEKLDDAARKRREFALGFYPTPRSGSIVSRVWKRHCRPWKPGMGNNAVALSPEERAEAIEEARVLFAASSD